jgi:drug/metabolite transporter (DMT)-like permease
MNRTAVIYALISAALFGVSTPAAKMLIGSIHPAVLAGLLYCGAGLGIALLRRILPSFVTRAPEVALSRAEIPWLAGAIAAGGVAGPLLLMFGLTGTDAAAASLLLTLEGAATASMAWFKIPDRTRTTSSRHLYTSFEGVRTAAGAATGEITNVTQAFQPSGRFSAANSL